MPAPPSHSTCPFWRRIALAFLAACLVPPAAWAAEVRVAVAANFAEAAEAIGAAFGRESGQRVVFSAGASGLLFGQIAQGAPFDVFLSADRQTVDAAIAAGLALSDTRFTYARGRLVLVSRDPGRVAGRETLSAGRFERLAIADPRTAPYGAAAVQAMEALGVAAALRPKLVIGTSIAKTYQFVATGNAELGFVALAQVARHDQGSRWLVPAELHAPIEQDAVLLARGVEQPAARAFLAYLGGKAGRTIVESFGYAVGE